MKKTFVVVLAYLCFLAIAMSAAFGTVAILEHSVSPESLNAMTPNSRAAIVLCGCVVGMMVLEFFIWAFRKYILLLK
jgi:hypothetical protein